MWFQSQNPPFAKIRGLRFKPSRHFAVTSTEGEGTYKQTNKHHTIDDYKDKNSPRSCAQSC